MRSHEHAGLARPTIPGAQEKVSAARISFRSASSRHVEVVDDTTRRSVALAAFQRKVLAADNRFSEVRARLTGQGEALL